MPEEGSKGGNKQLQAVEGELSVTFVQLVDALGGEGDASRGLAKEVGHFVALSLRGAFFIVHNSPTQGKERKKERKKDVHTFNILAEYRIM